MFSEQLKSLKFLYNAIIMSVYPPPKLDLPVFDSENFNTEALINSFVDFPVAQGDVTLQGVQVNGNLNVDGILTAGAIDLVSLEVQNATIDAGGFLYTDNIDTTTPLGTLDIHSNVTILNPNLLKVNDIDSVTGSLGIGGPATGTINMNSAVLMGSNYLFVDRIDQVVGPLGLNPEGSVEITSIVNPVSISMASPAVNINTEVGDGDLTIGNVANATQTANVNCKLLTKAVESTTTIKSPDITANTIKGITTGLQLGGTGTTLISAASDLSLLGTILKTNVLNPYTTPTGTITSTGSLSVINVTCNQLNTPAVASTGLFGITAVTSISLTAPATSVSNQLLCSTLKANPNTGILAIAGATADGNVTIGIGTNAVQTIGLNAPITNAVQLRSNTIQSQTAAGTCTIGGSNTANVTINPTAATTITGVTLVLQPTTSITISKPPLPNYNALYSNTTGTTTNDSIGRMYSAAFVPAVAENFTTNSSKTYGTLPSLGPGVWYIYGCGQYEVTATTSVTRASLNIYAAIATDTFIQSFSSPTGAVPITTYGMTAGGIICIPSGQTRTYTMDMTIVFNNAGTVKTPAAIAPSTFLFKATRIA